MRRLAARFAAILVALAVLWSGAWLWIAGDIERRLGIWVEERRGEGLAVAHGPVSVAGFPLRWRVAVADLDLAGAGPAGWRWRGDAFEAELKPWRIREVPFRLPGRHLLNANPDIAVVMRAERAEGLATLGPDGRLAALALELAAVAGDIGAAPVTMREARIAMRLFPTAATDRRATTLEAEIAVLDLDLPASLNAPLGRRVKDAALDFAFKGRLPGGRFPAALAAWRDDGGAIEVARLALAWGGVNFDGAATLAVDAANRPLAAGTVRLAGYNEAIDALVKTGHLRPLPAAGLKIGLALGAKPGPNGTPRIDAPFRAQDGVLVVRFAGQDIVIARLGPIVAAE